jgi:DNA polymerase-1
VRETCLIVDGHSLMHRAFHALPLMDADGVYTNAVHGFLSMLLKAFEDHTPQYCIVAFDESGPTFRHTDYPEYKAGRPPMREELRPQFPVIREILSAMGIGVLSLAGYEADDLLGTAARQCTEHDVDSMLLTGDKDALQLVDSHVSLLFPRRGISETTLYTTQSVKEAFGVTPSQVTDWKGLMGDTSDNIPGIPGVGEKTAVRLLDEYGTLDAVLAHADDIKGKLGERIRNNKDQALLSRQLAVINRYAPVEVSLADWRLTRLEDGLPALKKYQLNTISERLKKMLAASEPTASSTDDGLAWQAWRMLDTPEALQAFMQHDDGKLASVCLSSNEFTVAMASGRRGRAVFEAAQQSMFSESHCMTQDEALQAIAPVLATAGIRTHDAKQLLHRAAKAGCAPCPIRWDTMVAAYLHNPQEKSYALQHFAAPDASGIFDLIAAQQRQLCETGMEALYTDIELPLVRVLYDMEVAGFQVDRDALENLGKGFSARTQELQDAIYQSSGVSGFNLNSPQQLGKVLFDDLGLPARRKTKLGYSTDAATLEAIADLHPVVPLVMEYRVIAKLNGTYIDPMLRKVDSCGRIHTTFDQTGTATGRISSNEPNLQNIPVRTEMGRDIRRAFTARPGFLLVDADYSQIELRILAHMSQDEAMCDAFSKGQDIHTRTAAEVNGVHMDQVTSQMRSAAKAINFGIVYGISDFGLARNIGITRREAANFITRYFERYPGVHAWMDDAVKKGYANGYAATLYHRRRYLDELKSSNANTRSFGERAAMNTPIQGTAADIIKAAMVQVHNRLRQSRTKAQLILQVHDELLVEAPEDEAPAIAAMMKESMEGIIQLNVPLVCDVNIGKSWYDTK